MLFYHYKCCHPMYINLYANACTNRCVRLYVSLRSSNIVKTASPCPTDHEIRTKPRFSCTPNTNKHTHTPTGKTDDHHKIIKPSPDGHMSRFDPRQITSKTNQTIVNIEFSLTLSQTVRLHDAHKPHETVAVTICTYVYNCDFLPRHHMAGMC